MKRLRRSKATGALACVLVCLVAAGCFHGAQRERSGGVIFEETFGSSELDPGAWAITRENDFQESTIDIVDADAAPETEDRRLRLRAATIGTDDRTVKFHGVRTVQPVVDLAGGATVRFQLDWNDQRNGSYLTAGVYICPIATDTNPRDAADWLKVEYIGVPPGKNARCLIVVRNGGRLLRKYTEGWPGTNRQGREIGVVDVTMTFGPGRRLDVTENGTTVFSTPDHGLRFDRAHLYLQMSSHSNYPARTIYFDSLSVRRLE